MTGAAVDQRQPKQGMSFYKLDIQGIVYLVDPNTAKAYTYDLKKPTEIGKVVWKDVKASPTIELLPNWKEILTSKFDDTETSL